MSKKCIKCGAELDDIAVFCDECGTKQIIQHAGTGNEKAFSKVNPQNPANSTQTFSSEETLIYSNSIGKKNSALGIASLVFGIISILSFGVLIIPELIGLIIGFIDLKNSNYKHSFTIAGIILSILSIVLFIIMMVIGSHA